MNVLDFESQVLRFKRISHSYPKLEQEYLLRFSLFRNIIISYDSKTRYIKLWVNIKEQNMFWIFFFSYGYWFETSIFLGNIKSYYLKSSRNGYNLLRRHNALLQ